jgi:hypothetical protein
MLCTITRFIWARQEQHIVETCATLRLKFNILLNICYRKVKLVVHEFVMQSIKAHLVHKEQYLKIGTRGFDFNFKSMFFEDSSKIEQQIDISLHLVYSNLS